MTTQPKEPLLRMAKRDSISPRAAWGIRAAAFLLALITGGLLLLLLGHNPITVYSAMISGAWGSPTVARETVKIAVPLLITSIGISLAFRMKFWNIGAEGQILVGAIAAGWFGLFTATIFPKIPLVLLMMASSMILGGLYGLLPAICKAKWGTNETLFTLMLNYIALAFVKYLMNGPWKAPGSSYPKIAMLAPGARLTKVLGVHWGWILALVLVVVSYVYITRTKQGYEIAVVGESANTARYAGHPGGPCHVPHHVPVRCALRPGGHAPVRRSGLHPHRGHSRRRGLYCHHRGLAVQDESLWHAGGFCLYRHDGTGFQYHPDQLQDPGLGIRSDHRHYSVLHAGL